MTDIYYFIISQTLARPHVILRVKKIPFQIVEDKWKRLKQYGSA